MDPGVSTSGSVTEPKGLRQRIVFWFLLDGNRIAVTACIVAGVVAIVGSFTAVGLLDVGAQSSAATVFGSGLTSGVVTVVTIALSINQLILSRVFDAPNDLADRLEGTRDLRQTVEELAGEPSSPNDPAAFLSMLAETLRDHAASLEEAIVESGWDAPAEVTSAIRDLVAYGEDVDDHLDDQADIVDVLNVVLGTEYAENMTATRHLRNAYAASLPEAVDEEFDAVDQLLESIAITRQFFKTLSLQEDFARFSRIVVYSGLVALVATISLTLVYRTDSVTIPPSVLPAVVSVGIGVIVIPLAAFVAYLLRAATIAKRTVSVGPFIPPRTR